MATKVAINGFGRIGRNVLRAALEKGTDLEFVAVNDLTDPKTLAHLLKYDSIYGPLEQEVRHDGDSIMVGRYDVQVFSEKDPALVPWEKVGADIVIEGTGLFRAKKDASKHLRGSVKKVIITAPAKEPDVTLADGDSIADVLSYVEYQPQQLFEQFRTTAEQAVRKGRITPAQRQTILDEFSASLRGYTYFEH